MNPGSEHSDGREREPEEQRGENFCILDQAEQETVDLPKAQESNPMADVASTQSSSFLTVGIGASAGGLEAFQTFFRHMGENSGMAFVLISHLAPDHDSLLSELLAKETQMPVLQVQEETRLQPNQVYVIPPNATLTVEDGILRLSTPVQARGHRAPINIFFRSLAEDQGENAVCVILSGSGSDGTIGLKSIKEFNGLAIAQDSETAKYDSMPRNAVMTGLVDYVLPVEEIPAKLIEYARHRDGLQANLGEDGMLPQAADYLSQICSLLRRRIGHDFSNYKQGTLVRRIQRRIQITQNTSVEGYVQYLKSESDEVNLLFKDLLIGVTHFFRDPDAFDALKHSVIAPLVENSHSDKSVRIWVAGCSSGEEAYSIAMLLSEEMERQNARPQIQIFATDIDEHALEQARHARYPESIAEQMTPERLERFFIKQNGIYQVVKHLREMCIFSQQSLISDPPFSRLDLIACRNLLIYFDSDLQKQLIPLFHYALRTDGYLFLGSSENLSEYGELFRNISKPHRLFQRKQPMIAPQVDFPLVDRSLYRQLSQLNTKPVVSQQSQITRSIERVLLQEYTPACVIVNEQNEIVYYFGRTGKYIEPPQGLPNNNLFDLVKLGLRLDLRSVLQTARASRQLAMRERVSLEADGQVMLTDLIARPVKDANQDSGLLMVIFQDSIKPATSDQPRGNPTDLQEETSIVAQLEDELRLTKEQLRGTIEEIETSNEELKSANEELLSMNEEMQSSNEELQTSKEEMQSINEELETVNAELRNKVEELDAANSDVQNLFESTQIATIFLDHVLRIKRFTPDATRLFHLIEADIGRPITDISLSLEEGVSIAADVREVLRSLIPIEREVQFVEQTTAYKMRILPYRTLDNVISGVVLTFVDVTSLRQARERAERWAQRQSAIAELGTYALQENSAAEICDRATKIICQTLNSDLCSFFAVQADARDTLLLQSGSGWPSESVGYVTVSAASSHPGYTLVVQQPVLVADFAQESRFTQSIALQSLKMVSGISVIVHGTDEAYGILTSHSTQANHFTQEEVSFLQSIANVLAAALQREKTANALAKSRERLDLALDAGTMGVWDLNVITGQVTWNRIEYELLGLNPGDDPLLSNVNLFYQYVHPEDSLRVRQQVMQAIVQKTDFNSEFRINRADGQLRWLAGKGRVFTDADGNVIKVIGVNYDITERKQNEEALQDAARRKDDFLAALGHELRNPLNALSGSIALMQSAVESDYAASLYPIAQRQIEQLTRLMDDLLDVSRISHGKIQINLQPTDLTPIIHSLVADYQPAIAEKAISLTLSVPNQPIWVQGDAVRLMQAFSNILQNAIKFSNCNDRIDILTTLQDGQVTIKIIDSGIGIEPESLSRIFIPFSQEERSLARSGGLGLGLPLAKGIIELHNGRIWAESLGLNQGTGFIIQLRCLEEVENNTLESDARTSTLSESRDALLQLGRILIIEDNEDSGLMLQFFLENLGHQVAIATDGETGLAVARQFKPDVIISDIGLTAAMDGYTLAQIIRQDSSLTNTYLIAASGYGQLEDKARAEASGFDEHFTKPIDFDQLQSSVTRILLQLREQN